jgi:uridine kinase
VLQHIYEKDLSQYLSDIKNMTPKFIVHGRRFNDEIINGQHKNTWEILEKNNLFPDDTTGYSVSGNKSDHHGFVYSIKGQ